MIHRVSAIVLIFALSLGGSVALAQPATQPATQPADPPKLASQAEIVKASTTEHEIAVGGKPLKYRATAGTLAMKDEAGKEKASVFFVAYEKLPAGDPRQRPITYVFNGGPGAAAIWLHLGTAGPRRVELNANGVVPPPPHRVVDNEFTWLDSTDLVFIDPVGTGFSRAAQGEDAKQFYGVEQDVAAVADFIRLYTTRYERWASPKFLAGESYGTTRAAALSEYLLDRLGVSVNGIVFISTVLDFQTLSFGSGTDLPYPLYVPTYAAAAFHHKKLAGDLQKDFDQTIKEAEKWAIDVYTPALAKGDSIEPQQRAEIERQLARFTSLPLELIRRANLRVDIELFRSHLLVDSRRIIGRFDARITGFDPDPTSRNTEYDPSLSMYLAAYTNAFNSYVRTELKYESDLPYEALSSRVRPWDFGPAGNGYLFVANRLRNAMMKNPDLKVLFASGYYDLATPFFATDYTINHLGVGPDLRRNVSQTYYQGGHMMYHNSEDLRKLDRDVAGFISQTLVTERKGS